MNSYPLEFLAHPQPLMFVAGLEAPRPRAASSAASSTGGPAPVSGSGSGSPSPPLAGAGAASSSMSPSRDTSALPLMSPGLESAPLPPVPALNDPREAEFATLQADLRDVFSRFGGRGRVWIPEDERNAGASQFRVALVDKNVRLPLRKMHPERPGEETHSPLSPLTPASPLYPDGLIAPVWIRKHAELVPSVFVLFLRLFETPSPSCAAGGTSLGGEMLASFEREREKEADEALVREIAQRRQPLNDRGIKLTIVLMASAATLDAPGLDQRLSYIRRASQLSAKASLFVLTPVPAAELPDFVRSLHDALYEPAIEYYAAHGKRVRRKRGRASTIANSSRDSGGRARGNSISNQSKALGPQGWTVRYDFKAGWLAEMRGELDLARRHYEDCWNELAKMFSSTTILPPRTKRWAEAKVLADCVASRICRLLLYENAGSRVLVPFFVHLRRFGELCRGWGIGEETFEFWSWVARQYRLLGEVLDLAVQNGYELPPIPVPTYPAPPAVPSLDTLLPNSSNNAMHTLQSPAFYFYAAACCTIERKARMEAALAAQARGGTALTAAPGFANEKKVDHGALIVDLLTTAFNLLRDAGQEESGLALYIAFKTAQTHAKDGQYELGLRLLNRLEDKFRTENWSPLLSQLHSLQYECAQATGNVETAARLLIEMLAPQSGVAVGERAALQDDLLTLFKTTVPSSSDLIVLPLGDAALVDVRAGFRAATAPAGTPVPFQLRVSAPVGVDISKLEFSSLRIAFSDDRPDVILADGGTDKVINLGTVDGNTGDNKVALKFGPSDRPLVVTGQLAGGLGPVSISEVVLCMSYGAWNLELRVTTRELGIWTVGSTAFVPLKGIHPQLEFTPRPHAVTLSIDSPQLAFVDEASPIVVRVKSTDERKLDLALSVGLQDAEAATLSYSGTSDTVFHDIPVTLVDGIGEVALTLKSSRLGSAVVDVLLTSMSGEDRSEVASTTVVPVMAPFECQLLVSRSSGGFATVSAVLRVPARKIEATALDVSAAAEGVTLQSSSLAAATLPMIWDSQTPFALAARFKLQQLVSRMSAPPGNAGLINIKWRAADTADGRKSEEITTTIPLPPLAPVPPEAFVTCSLSSPPIVQAHTPFSLQLTVANAHPSESAYVVVAGDTADGFVWAGPRGARVGPVPPGGSARVVLAAIAVGASGWQALPHVNVWHGEGPDRREVRVGMPEDRPLGAVLVQP